MFELPPFLLALAFVAVFVAAWLLGRHAGGRTVRLPRDYYVGLDHLINDRFDRAAEVFTRVAASKEDAAEIQFALGSLFRKRGEVDRAIAIHTRLKDQGAPAIRERAAFALALDFLSAGLMDRAERLFEELAASREHRRDALEYLLRIYEQQGDWANALKVFHDLPADLQQERRSVAAHYLCELAEHAMLQGEAERARALVKQARSHDATLPRAEILAARMMEAAGDARGALERYLDALEAAPALALEVIPRLLALGKPAGERQLIEELCARLGRTGRLTPRQLAWLLATALPLEDAGRLERIAGELIGIDGTASAPSFGQLLARIGEAGGRYQCEECGLSSVGWFWRCPKCRSWDGMRPAVFKWAERTDETAAQGAAPRRIPLGFRSLS
ncbi:MAG TPA: tetratricopeptide repeat protein [Steroidobacteraceae bacterium]|nr:tetratricopeptide repeat protein [Steroidobacteraceae bacterium]